VSYFIYYYAVFQCAECCCVECRYAECHYAECRYADYCYAECQYAEYHYAVCRYAVYRYAECRYAECRGARLFALGSPFQPSLILARKVGAYQSGAPFRLTCSDTPSHAHKHNIRLIMPGRDKYYSLFVTKKKVIVNMALHK
jgi:hypothetical protein